MIHELIATVAAVLTEVCVVARQMRACSLACAVSG